MYQWVSNRAYLNFKLGMGDQFIVIISACTRSLRSAFGSESFFYFLKKKFP